MRLLLYYGLHSVKNQIRKLFKTWVVVFIIICLVFGGVCGGIAAFFAGSVSDENAEPDTGYEQMTDEEKTGDDGLSTQQLNAIVGLVAGAGILLYLGYSIVSGNKNGSAVFQMADVNLLFSAPMKPQSVLFFRLMCQIGVMIVATLYLGFQIPNLHYNLGLSIFSCIALMIAWAFTLIFGKLLSLFTYSVSSTHENMKKYILPTVTIIAAAIALVFMTYNNGAGGDIFTNADKFFNSKYVVFVPVWGWIKSIVDFAVADNLLMLFVMCFVCIVGVVLLVTLNWHIKVDFYEDAMAKSAETAELQAKLQSEGKTILKRKKDRSEKLRRNGKMNGSGASAFFHKEMYNRFRFAKLGIFTSTSLTYLAAAAVTLIFLIKNNYYSIEVIAFVIGGFAFFRALNNPLAKEAGMDAFILVPEKAYLKIFWSQAAGSINCALDILPAFIVSAVMLKANILLVIFYLFVIITVDFYSSCIATAIDLSLPSSIAKTIKTMLSILFVYFGLLPDIIIIAIVGVAFKNITLALGLAALINAALGAVGIAISAHFINTGKK